ncbi:MAG: L-histidine N(alpha)-methyltransferase [Candidatus Zixiibacteriota bacterium]
MGATYKVIDPADFADSFSETHEFALDILVGLSEFRKSIASKYLYDAEGSRLFTEITRLPEYYLTGCELEILQAQAAAIVRHVQGAPFNLVELGAGDGQKTSVLIEHFLGESLDFQYVPIDISESAMRELTGHLGERFPALDTHGIVSEYFNGFKWLNHRHSRRNFVLLLGSNIGNFTHAEARFFLRNLWNVLNPGDRLLLGFDLKKDIELLLDAYNDPAGVTSAFNLNVLTRINRELGGEFDTAKFRHFGTYDVFSGAMESYLVSLERQSVFIGAIGRAFSFNPWEPIHTEYSYKYLVSDIEKLASETGFTVREHLFDSRRYFADSIWEVNKPGVA